MHETKNSFYLTGCLDSRTVSAITFKKKRKRLKKHTQVEIMVIALNRTQKLKSLRVRVVVILLQSQQGQVLRAEVVIAWRFLRAI